jgi:hypothetical protein
MGSGWGDGRGKHLFAITDLFFWLLTPPTSPLLIGHHQPILCNLIPFPFLLPVSLLLAFLRPARNRNQICQPPEENAKVNLPLSLFMHVWLFALPLQCTVRSPLSSSILNICPLTPRYAVTLTNTKKQGRAHKTELVDKIRAAVDEFENLFLLSFQNMRSNKFKQVRMEWKDSRFFLGKNKIMQVALGRTEEEEYRENMSKISEVNFGLWRLTANLSTFHVRV